MSRTAYSERLSPFELAAAKLLLCAQAAGAHHQTTPMTRAPVASERGKINRSAGKPHFLPGESSNNVVSTCHLAVSFVALSAFLTAALTLAIHPIAAVLLALGAMGLVVHVVSTYMKN
jgi:hypothetical protein